MDGLPYLVQSLVLGTILAGPAIIYLHTGRVFTSRKLSGGNLWVILAIATVPQMLSLVCWCAGSNSPSLTIAAFALWYLPVPIQAITLPIATGLVMFSQMHDASIRPLDRIGIALAGIWSLTVMYQVYAVMRFGIPQ